MRIATRHGRSVLISPDATSLVDVAEASQGRFGPGPRSIYDAWDEFVDWAEHASIDFATEGIPLILAELGAPSPDPRQVFAIGLNYRDHADESGFDYPTSPPTFTKFASSFTGPVGALSLPTATVDWEAELVVVVGRRAERVTAAEAWSYVAGLTVGQDYSERALQLAGPAPQFSLGKSFPGFAPQGPWLVTLDEVADPDDLPIECRINGEAMQRSSTKQLIFSVPQLVEHLSAVLPLMPGDIVFTGTPAGIGGARKPARFLLEGDVVETRIGGIGELRQVCVGSAETGERQATA
ncbi:fumarylacetoacetate hydrolase family protein [Streptomyces sp. GMR22]|uniref:fumarylacetoacetate hydrolase family protein n=1 Tax=Streptomyces sp. GMR22 TaxID=2759524 RepID=UPI0015F8B072|nr:fumarylacetoacetate hydrolase family protein [Streptomyces sp. GMR22]MBA6434612.1 fumarylacetoacetate hydrolase family protein [Streptomyces sp. GMR22]